MTLCWDGCKLKVSLKEGIPLRVAVVFLPFPLAWFWFAWSFWGLCKPTKNVSLTLRALHKIRELSSPPLNKPDNSCHAIWYINHPSCKDHQKMATIRKISAPGSRAFASVQGCPLGNWLGFLYLKTNLPMIPWFQIFQSAATNINHYTFHISLRLMAPQNILFGGIWKPLTFDSVGSHN